MGGGGGGGNVEIVHVFVLVHGRRGQANLISYMIFLLFSLIFIKNVYFKRKIKFLVPVLFPFVGGGGGGCGVGQISFRSRS